VDVAWLDRILGQTLEDLRLSRGERRALTATLMEAVERTRDLDLVRSRAFAVAAGVIPTRRGRLALEWLEEVVKVVAGLRAEPPPEVLAEAVFSPGDRCLQRLVGLIGGAQSAIDVCVYTITDDRIAAALLGAHRRGATLRIVTDNAKSSDLGSDVDRLEAAGIPVAVDRGPGHMHHKFALFDGRTVAAGSYNWTRSAADDNHEDLIVTDNPQLVARFTEEFDRLWKRFRG
jgi:phosphatidylserine/phosphatidylglycerophosphate/cardiolipin synthase-like enzyme